MSDAGPDSPNLDQQEQVRRWIGIGPGKVGRNLVGKEVGMKGTVRGGGVWGITSPAEAEELMKDLDATEYDPSLRPISWTQPLIMSTDRPTRPCLTCQLLQPKIASAHPRTILAHSENIPPLESTTSTLR